MNPRCFRCGRLVEDGEGVQEVRLAVVRDGVLSTDSSERVVHAACPAEYARRLN